METARAKEVAIEAALRAGAYIRESVGKIDKIDYKSAFNLVTNVDQQSEVLILEIIKRAFPGDSVLGEEGGGSVESQGRRWLIDPVDGTTNFAHSYPFFCVSIGLEIDGVLSVGVVYNPISSELFTAEKGKGAFLNDKKIQVSNVASLSESLLATGFPPDTETTMHNNMRAFFHVTNKSHGVRRDGSAALDLCYVACGRLEAFWEYKLSPWDIGAGTLIVTEAGGTVTNMVNGPLDMKTGNILASNGKIHDELVQEIEISKSSTAKFLA